MSRQRKRKAASEALAIPPPVHPAVVTDALVREGAGILDLSQWTRLLDDNGIKTLCANLRRIAAHQRQVAAAAVLRRLPPDPPRAIRVVNVRGANRLSPWALTYLAQTAGTGVVSLCLEGCAGLDDAGLQTAAVSCPGLQELVLDGCHGPTAVGLGGAAEALPRLRRLSLKGCAGITDLGLSRVGACCHRLEELCVAECAGVTDDGIRALASGCTALRVIDMSAGPAVTDTGIISLAKFAPQLEVFRLCRPRLAYLVSDDAFAVLGSQCPRLKVIDLTGCDRVTDVGLRWLCTGAPGLLSLNISGCRYVGDGGMLALSASCPHLRRLAIAHCKLVSDIGLRHIATGCQRLEHLDVNGLVLLTDGRLRPALVSKHLTGVPTNGRLFDGLDAYKKGEAAEVLLDGWEVGLPAVALLCKRLQHLSCGGCESIGDITARRLASGCGPNLVALNLSRTRSLGGKALATLLSVAGRTLRSLDLHASAAVDSVSVKAIGQHCHRLTSLNLSECRGLPEEGLRYLVLGCTSLTELLLNDLPQLSDIACYHLAITAGTTALAAAEAKGAAAAAQRRRRPMRRGRGAGAGSAWAADEAGPRIDAEEAALRAVEADAAAAEHAAAAAAFAVSAAASGLTTSTGDGGSCVGRGGGGDFPAATVGSGLGLLPVDTMSAAEADWPHPGAALGTLHARSDRLPAEATHSLHRDASISSLPLPLGRPREGCAGHAVPASALRSAGAASVRPAALNPSTVARTGESERAGVGSASHRSKGSAATPQRGTGRGGPSNVGARHAPGRDAATSKSSNSSTRGRRSDAADVRTSSAAELRALWEMDPAATVAASPALLVSVVPPAEQTSALHLTGPLAASRPPVPPPPPLHVSGRRTHAGSGNPGHGEFGHSDRGGGLGASLHGGVAAAPKAGRRAGLSAVSSVGAGGTQAGRTLAGTRTQGTLPRHPSTADAASASGAALLESSLRRAGERDAETRPLDATHAAQRSYLGGVTGTFSKRTAGFLHPGVLHPSTGDTMRTAVADAVDTVPMPHAPRAASRADAGAGAGTGTGGAAGAGAGTGGAALHHRPGQANSSALSAAARYSGGLGLGFGLESTPGAAGVSTLVVAARLAHQRALVAGAGSALAHLPSGSTHPIVASLSAAAASATAERAAARKAEWWRERNPEAQVAPFRAPDGSGVYPSGASPHATNMHATGSFASGGAAYLDTAAGSGAGGSARGSIVGSERASLAASPPAARSAALRPALTVSDALAGAPPAGENPSDYAAGPLEAALPPIPPTMTLRTLHMRGCKLVSDTGLSWILQQHTGIRELNVLGSGVTKGSLIAAVHGAEGTARGPCLVRDDAEWFGIYPRPRSEDFVREAEYARQWAASIRLQALWRGYAARQRVWRLREADLRTWLAAQLQALARGARVRAVVWRERRGLATKLRALVLIALAWKRFKARRTLAATQVRAVRDKIYSSIVTMQRNWRRQLRFRDEAADGRASAPGSSSSRDGPGGLAVADGSATGSAAGALAALAGAGGAPYKRRRVRYLRREASLDIQRVWRGHATRRHMPALRQAAAERLSHRRRAVMLIQAGFVAYLARMRARRQRAARAAAAARLKRWWRRVLARRWRAAEKTRQAVGAMELQRLWRGVQGRRRAAAVLAEWIERRRQERAGIVGRWWRVRRVHIGLRASAGIRHCLRRAATDFQRLWRGTLGRVRALQYRRQRDAARARRTALLHWAATRLQCFWRRVLAVRAYRALHAATVPVPLNGVGGGSALSRARAAADAASAFAGGYAPSSAGGYRSSGYGYGYGGEGTAAVALGGAGYSAGYSAGYTYSGGYSSGGHASGSAVSAARGYTSPAPHSTAAGWGAGILAASGSGGGGGGSGGGPLAAPGFGAAPSSVPSYAALRQASTLRQGVGSGASDPARPWRTGAGGGYAGTGGGARSPAAPGAFADVAWQLHVDPSSGASYYFHAATGESRWA